MRQSLAWLFILAIFFLVSYPISAQTSGDTTIAAGPFRYDSANEVTICGTVSAALSKAGPGMVVGPHLLIATASGLVDASLGRFGLLGTGSPPIGAGQQVEATGVMRTIKDRPVLLVRAVKVGSAVYVIRNIHGVLLAPRARGGAELAAERKGVWQ